MAGIVIASAARQSMYSDILDCRVATLLAMTEEIVIASAAWQSMYSDILDCHVATLLAMTEEIVIASAARPVSSLRAQRGRYRHCERSVAIHVFGHPGLPRR
ncbi:hypothetical protein [Rhodoferax sp.]|uniref:hypothetical protein n=1 Tax=Rhodoferax sp. TaxID=50421 RepID=UPI003BB02BA6